MDTDYSLSLRDFMPCNNPNMTDIQPDVQSAGEKGLYQFVKQRTAERVIGIPTNMWTTPLGSNGWQYRISGGDSSAAPYLAGVYACALSGNKLFMTRPNWQAELNEILKSTTTRRSDGIYVINPSGIRARITEIVKQMEMNLIKQNVVSPRATQ